MLHQVAAHLLQPAIQRAPGIACVGRRGDVVGQQCQSLQRVAVLLMLVAHYRDRPLRLREAHAALQHREENLFLLQHVAFQLLLHMPQVFGETVGAFGAAAMDLLDPAGQANQLRELIAMPLMKARQDVFDQLASGLGAPVFLGFFRLEGEQGAERMVRKEYWNGDIAEVLVFDKNNFLGYAEFNGKRIYRKIRIDDGIVYIEDYSNDVELEKYAAWGEGSEGVKVQFSEGYKRVR